MMCKRLQIRNCKIVQQRHSHRTISVGSEETYCPPCRILPCKGNLITLFYTCLLKEQVQPGNLCSKILKTESGAFIIA